MEESPERMGVGKIVFNLKVCDKTDIEKILGLNLWTKK